MKVIGLTGSFGTGKTFVASVFRSLGANVLDADRIAHWVMRRNSSAYKRVVGAFGRVILDKDGNIRRNRLANIVFDNKRNLKKLCQAIHPEVIKVIKKRIAQAKDKDVIVIDAPLLVEANLTDMVDYLIVVKSSRRHQIERCVKKFRINEEEVLERIENQIPITKKIKLADFVIDNDGTKWKTRIQTRKIWREILWK